MRTIGILLLIVGAVGLIWGGVTYITDRDTVDLGVAEVVTEEKGRVSIPPVYAGAALLLGGLLVGLSARNKHKSSSTVTVSKTVDTQP